MREKELLKALVQRLQILLFLSLQQVCWYTALPLSQWRQQWWVHSVFLTSTMWLWQHSLFHPHGGEECWKHFSFPSHIEYAYTAAGSMLPCAGRQTWASITQASVLKIAVYPRVAQVASQASHLDTNLPFFPGPSGCLWYPCLYCSSRASTCVSSLTGKHSPNCGWEQREKAWRFKYL